MKKLLPILILFVLSMAGKAGAQRISRVDPNVILVPTGGFTRVPSVDVFVKGRNLRSNPPTAVYLNLPWCGWWLYGAPYSRTRHYGDHAYQVINDSTIHINDVYLDSTMFTSEFDVWVVFQNDTLIKPAALKLLNLRNSGSYTVTPAFAEQGQTLDVLVTGSGHDQISSTFLPLDQISSTLHVDFGRPDALGGANFTEQLPNGFLANITIPSNTPVGCYDVLIREIRGNWNQFHCQNQSKKLCVTAASPPRPARISGRVIKDWNHDCQASAGEDGIRKVMVQATPGPYYAQTDAGGNYSLELPYGNYAISQRLFGSTITPICPVGNRNVTVSAANPIVTGQDLGDTVIPKTDMRFGAWGGRPKPGFQTEGIIYMSNLGDSTETATVKLLFKAPSTLQFVNSIPAPGAVNGDTLIYSGITLRAWHDSAVVRFTYSLPPVLGPMDSSVALCVFMKTARPNQSPYANDVYCISGKVGFSFDPNDKSVSPKGDLAAADSVLEYTIRFQNTGTAAADFVIVRDTLDADLDVGSIKTTLATHRFEFSLIGQNIAQWRFSNIQLPDSNTNEPGSHGAVQFTINRKPGLTPGTHIDNRAGIYFDFNPPVMTNTVTSMLAIPTKVKQGMPGDGISIYPNPVRGQRFLRFISETDLTGSAFTLTDALGRQVMQSIPVLSGQVTLGRKPLAHGLYFFSLKKGDRTLASGKLVVE